jgi:acetoin utilization protein AcuB
VRARRANDAFSPAFAGGTCLALIGRMNAKTLTVGDRMTPAPHLVGAEQPLSTAHALMRKHGIRHLPVLRGGRLAGVLSLGDLHLVETLPDSRPEDVRIEDAMSTDVYAVSPATPLREVASTMAARKVGSAVVVSGLKVVGMFTTVDALDTLALVLTQAV